MPTLLTSLALAVSSTLTLNVAAPDHASSLSIEIIDRQGPPRSARASWGQDAIAALDRHPSLNPISHVGFEGEIARTSQRHRHSEGCKLALAGQNDALHQDRGIAGLQSVDDRGRAADVGNMNIEVVPPSLQMPAAWKVEDYVGVLGEAKDSVGLAGGLGGAECPDGCGGGSEGQKPNDKAANADAVQSFGSIGRSFSSFCSYPVWARIAAAWLIFIIYPLALLGVWEWTWRKFRLRPVGDVVDMIFLATTLPAVIACEGLLLASILLCWISAY